MLKSSGSKPKENKLNKAEESLFWYKSPVEPKTIRVKGLAILIIYPRVEFFQNSTLGYTLYF
jgi:hypothetical protein